ncbi:hypothetical protein, conserved [Eimeria maxima]|uniref:Uncharacterized protein n=1 Tax=Eimeria maxima TaxID=5804 RepID=U6MJT9_EIMMA|nr:hypothetical protein, conserved [Eimeria maxima]CDJ61915.1 hypothetical protein, conserved [Eimeria maxima]
MQQQLTEKDEEIKQQEKTANLLLKLSEQTLKRQHEEELNELEKEKEAEKELYEYKLSSLIKKNEQQKKTFNQRLSREEDLNTIKQLQQTLNQTKTTLAQREEQIRNLKLELITQ